MTWSNLPTIVALVSPHTEMICLRLYSWPRSQTPNSNSTSVLTTWEVLRNKEMFILSLFSIFRLFWLFAFKFFSFSLVECIIEEPVTFVTTSILLQPMLPTPLIMFPYFPSKEWILAIIKEKALKYFRFFLNNIRINKTHTLQLLFSPRKRKCGIRGSLRLHL